MGKCWKTMVPKEICQKGKRAPGTGISSKSKSLTKLWGGNLKGRKEKNLIGWKDLERSIEANIYLLSVVC